MMLRTTSLEKAIEELEAAFLHQEEGNLYRFILRAVEKPLIESALERTEGNQLKAAKLLGINRNTLRSKMRKLRIRKWG